MEKMHCSELLDLVAQREGVLLAEGDRPGDPLVSAWLAQLSPLQLDMLSRYDERVDHHRARALAGFVAGQLLGASQRMH